MMAQTKTQAQVVAEAVVGDVAIEFYDDGSAVMAAAMTVECPWCGALQDREGEAVALAPDAAWGLLQAVRQHLPVAAYRQATKAIVEALNGPES